MTRDFEQGLKLPLLAELKRRNVFRVAAFYLVVSWLILQVADVVFGVAQVLVVPGL